MPHSDTKKQKKTSPPSEKSVLRRKVATAEPTTSTQIKHGKRKVFAPAMPGLSVRHVALDLAIAVLNENKPLDDCLLLFFKPGTPGGELDHRDRAYIRKLVATLLRHLGDIDATISQHLRSDLPPKGSAKMILRLGVCQILYLRTPAHAAVDLTLHLADQRKAGGLKGLMNAVLRKISKQKDQILDQLPEKASLNTPKWLFDRWAQFYGTETALKIAAQHVVDPPIDLTVKETPEKWADLFKGTLLPTGTLRCQPQGPLNDWMGYEEGAWWAQDVSAALPAKLFGTVSGLEVYDLCAAPGGKTAQLIQQGAKVTAIDKSAARLSILHQNLERLQLDAECIHADVLTWKPGQKADAILLDAPCSATGTARRHPDMPWQKKESDIQTLANLQFKLLAKSLSLIKPGGMIIYCTCSLEPEEGEQQIDHFLKEFKGQIKRVPIRSQELELPEGALLPSGDLRILPHHGSYPGGMDGFFISRLSYGV